MAFTGSSNYIERLLTFVEQTVIGLIPGIDTRSSWGENDAIGATTVTIWDEASVYTYMPEASTVTVSSDSVEDALAGTGAWLVWLQGLDSNFVRIDEIIVLTGQAPVTSQYTYIRVYSMRVFKANAAGINVGNIYAGTGEVVDGVPANVYAKIRASNGRSMMAMYTVPRGYYFILKNVDLTCGSGKQVLFNLFARPYGGIFERNGSAVVYQNSYQLNLTNPLVAPEGTDIEIRASSAPITAYVVAAIEGKLIKKNLLSNAFVARFALFALPDLP